MLLQSYLFIVSKSYLKVFRFRHTLEIKHYYCLNAIGAFIHKVTSYF